jgi:hypothetical protein
MEIWWVHTNHFPGRECREWRRGAGEDNRPEDFRRLNQSGQLAVEKYVWQGMANETMRLDNRRRYHAGVVPRRFSPAFLSR